MSLKPEQNDLLTRVENSAPMGRYLKETMWFPVMISSVLEPAAPPRLVRLIGENYVIFRGESGRVGFFAELCPHRNASLLLARNEGDALRCIFHGWKFSAEGRTLEVPTQRTHHDEFCRRVPLEHFPTHEAGGVIWVWLGNGKPALLPDFLFMKLSGEHVAPAHSILDFNWIQAVEGLVDSAHVSILHTDWLKGMAINPALANAAHDAAPVYEFEEKPDGFRYAAIRDAPDNHKYVRITEYVGPWSVFTPGDQRSCYICIPVDNEHTAFWSFRHDPDGSIGEGPWKPKGDPMNYPPPLPGDRSNRWGQDREAMRRGSFSGFPQHLAHEDQAAAYSQGKIATRAREYLNAGDAGVMRMRNWLLRAVKDFEAGSVAPPVARTINAGQGVIGDGEDWRVQDFFGPPRAVPAVLETP